MTEYVRHLNGAIAYEDHGTGPPIVCMPSLGDLRAEYRLLVPQLVDAGFRVLTMDLRGHGESSVGWDDYSVSAIGTDLMTLLRMTDIRSAIVIGTSASAGAAVWTAAEAPNLVRRLVLISPFVRDTIPPWRAKLMYAPLFVKPWGPALWIRYYRSLYPSSKPEDFDRYLNALRASLKEPGRMTAVRKMMTASKKASAQRLDQVDVPTLVVMGTSDPDFKDPAEEAEFIADELDAEVVLIEGAGHYPHVEMPDEASEAILEFVQAGQGGDHVA